MNALAAAFIAVFVTQTDRGTAGQQAPARGTVIDKIVAIVQDHIITLSDIRTEKVMREVLGEPVAANGQELLGELIDQHVADAQLDQYPNIEPSDEEIEVELGRIKDRKGLTPGQIRTAIRQHIRMQRFFEVRFAQFIQVTAEEIRKYYEEIFVPAARTRGLTPIPELSMVSEDIRRNVAAEKLDQDVKRWLDATRRAMKIDILGL